MGNLESSRVTTLSERAGGLLSARGWRVAVAESATGGLLGHLITKVPGSSEYFWGGVIAYANDLKMNLLGVRRESLMRWGAVSSQVAWEMAKGACAAAGTEVGISITGIAGPTGATPQKPVGLYFVGLALPHECWVWRHRFQADRVANNAAVAQAALAHLVTYLAWPSYQL